MYKKAVKPVLDYIIAIIAFPFFVLITLVVGAAILAEDRGSVFYRAERVGKHGKLYKMYKYRSMYTNAPDIRNADGSTYNAADDPRVTKVGRFIRKTSIDEIPQVLNILLGQMSVVGPRPDLPDQVEFYEENEKKRLSVKPGVTGYNQAYFRNSIDWKERIQNDIYYVENASFLLDIKIIAKTVGTVLGKKDIYSGGEGKNEERENQL